MSYTSTGTGVSGGDEIANKIISMQLTYLPKLGILLGKVQEILDQCKTNYLLQHRSDITRLQSNLQIPQDQYSRYNMDKLLALEQQIHDFVDSPKLSAAPTQKVQDAHVNQGPSSVYSSFMLPFPTPITGSQSTSWAMHRTDNSSVDNSVYTNTGYYPKQDPPPINTPDGLNTSSHGAASSIIGVATGTLDYSGYASYSTSNDQPYTPQVGRPQNPGSPYQALTSFQNSGSYQTSGGLGSNDYGTQITQANLWNDVSYASYSSRHHSDYTPANSSSARSCSTVDRTSEHFKQQWADYYSQSPSGVIYAPGTENKSTTSASTHDSQTTHWNILNHPLVPSRISGILRRSLASHTQPSPGTTSWQPQVDSSGTTSWNPPHSSSGMASWRPESISSATTSWKQVPTSYEITSWKPEPTPSNTTSWRPEPTSSSTISWRSEPTPSNSTSWKPVPPSTSWKPDPPPSSSISWGQGPTSTSTMSWRPELTSSGLLTVQGPNAAFQNYPVSHPPSHFQNLLDSNPVHYRNSHGLQQTACSPGPTSHFPATNPGAQTYTSLLQSGSSMDTRGATTLQIAADPSILHFLDDDQVEKEEALSKQDHKRRKTGR